MSPKEAFLLFAALSLLALGLVLTLNRLTVMLALAGGGIAVAYPFMKRVTSFPQVWLGAAFSWGIPMAFAAQLDTIPRVAWLMYFGGVVWTTAYDTMYAMVDRDDDLKIGIKSTAILFADLDRFWIGVMQLLALLALFLVGRQAELGFWYGIGLVVAGLFALHQQKLIRNRDRDRCLEAFLNNNYFGAAVFFGIVLDYTFQ